MKHVKLFESFSRRLPANFVEQIKRIYELDSSSVICGSTALFLHGMLDRTPNDIDVIVKDGSKLLGLKESLNDSPNFAVGMLNRPQVRIRVENMAKKMKDFYTFIEGVKYLLGGEEALGENMPEELYKEVSSIWNAKKDGKGEYYKKKNEHFEFKFSKKNELTRICVFEAKGEVSFTEFDMDGTRVLLESPETILEYKQFYDRDKDVDDLNEIKFTRTAAGMIPVGAKPQSFDPSRIKIKKADWNGMFDKVESLPAAKKVDLIKKLHALGLI